MFIYGPIPAIHSSLRINSRYAVKILTLNAWLMTQTQVIVHLAGPCCTSVFPRLFVYSILLRTVLYPTHFTGACCHATPIGSLKCVQDNCQPSLQNENCVYKTPRRSLVLFLKVYYSDPVVRWIRMNSSGCLITYRTSTKSEGLQLQQQNLLLLCFRYRAGWNKDGQNLIWINSSFFFRNGHASFFPLVTFVALLVINLGFCTPPLSTKICFCKLSWRPQILCSFYRYQIVRRYFSMHPSGVRLTLRATK